MIVVPGAAVGYLAVVDAVTVILAPSLPVMEPAAVSAWALVAVLAVLVTAALLFHGARDRSRPLARPPVRGGTVRRPAAHADHRPDVPAAAGTGPTTGASAGRGAGMTRGSPAAGRRRRLRFPTPAQIADGPVVLAQKGSQP